MCMAGVPWHNKDDWDMAPSMLNCDPESPSQRWSIDEQTGLVKNLGLGMCVQAVDGTPPFKVHCLPLCVYGFHPPRPQSVAPGANTLRRKRLPRGYGGLLFCCCCLGRLLIW